MHLADEVPTDQLHFAGERFSAESAAPTVGGSYAVRFQLVMTLLIKS